MVLASGGTRNAAGRGQRGACMSRRNLIFDIGVNEGEDSEFYLAKGFSVVGVEANPVLAGRVAEKLAGPIAEGRYRLINKGIWSERCEMPFYINLDNSHWSSFDRGYGTREDSRYEVVTVECLTIADLLREHGVPYFLKIDVEGADRIILQDLRKLDDRPDFVSVEEYGVEALLDLHALGYTSFKLVPQNHKSDHIPPNPPLEGVHVDRQFGGRDSGLFGLELPGEWLPFDTAWRQFVEQVRDEGHRWVGPPNEWFDIHARR
jgi:FkbM family methyltransferase